MSKQSDIREGIKEHLQQCLEVSGLTGLVSKSFADSFSRSLPVLLDGMGVVIKVDRELPDITEFMIGITSPLEAYKAGQKDAQFTMKEAGYVAVDSLIDTP